jgi:putative ABC transport system permease protein
VNIVGLLSAALEEVGSHRLRALLSTISILVGVATLVLIVALGEIAQSTARSVVERETGRPATLEVSTEESPVAFARSLDLVNGRLDRYEVAARSRLLTWSARAGGTSDARPVALIGADPGLAEVRRFRIESGRWLVPDDDELLAPVVVVNKTVAETLGVDQATRPSALRSLDYGVDHTTVRVVGVVDDGQDELRIYAPASVLLRRTGTAGLVGASVVAHVEVARAGLVAQRVTADFRGHGLGQTRILRVDEADAFASLFSLLQLVLASIAAVSLVTGALGVLNLGIVTSRQRAKEFAIRRSFGATSPDIFFMVIAESVTTTVFGGILGVGAAIVLLTLLPTVASGVVDVADLPPFPVNAALIGVAVALAIGLIAGVLPARLATRLSIIDTIRA